jgi:hypothetical protein
MWVILRPYTGTLPDGRGSYTRQINTRQGTIDYTYGGAPEPGPDMLLTFDASRGMSVDMTSGSLSQSGQLRVNYDNDFLSLLLGFATTFIDGSYQVDVTPLGFKEVPGSNFDGSNP